MKITDALLGEHAVFYAQFEYLERSVPSADTISQVKSLGALLAASLAGCLSFVSVGKLAANRTLPLHEALRKISLPHVEIQRSC